MKAFKFCIINEQIGSSAKFRSLQKKDFKIPVYISNSETDFNKIRQYAEEPLCSFIVYNLEKIGKGIVWEEIR